MVELNAINKIDVSPTNLLISSLLTEIQPKCRMFPGPIKFAE